MSDQFERTPLPRTRPAIRDMLRVGHRKHMIHGMTEVDVTHARQLIQEHKDKTGEIFSFTAFFVTCLAIAVGFFVGGRECYDQSWLNVNLSIGFVSNQ